MIAVGDKLDLDFPVKACAGGTIREVRFAALLTRRTIVSAYMKNNTPSCDRQNESLSAHAAEFRRAGYDVIAVSRDTASSQCRYAAAKGISHVLVSDPADRFAQAAGSLVPKTMYGRAFVGPARAAFILDVDGTVLAIVPKVDPAHHAAQLREALASP